MTASTHHLPIDVLLLDWLGEADAATRDAVDTHLMACDDCGALLEELLAIGDGIRGAVRAGRVSVVAGARFVERLAARGVRVREYRLAPGGSVNCTVAPQDEVVVSRLQAPLQGVRRLDVATELSIQPGVVHRMEDVPFDPATGEVLLLPSAALLRSLPAHTMHVTLLARGDGGSREVGRYEFRHSPCPGPADS